MSGRKLKVYGSRPTGRLYVPTTVSPHRQTRHVVAATCKTAACRLLGTTPAYTSESHNPDEVRAAMSEPGRVFWQADRVVAIYKPVPEST